jgi:nitrogen fixation/metabolism regulation signal transduction histidine kinase
MTGPAGSKPEGGRVRRALARMRVSRFELTIALALVVAATAPLAFAVYQAGRLTEHALAFGLDPRVVDRLESIPGLYLEIFRSRKQLYAAQARQIAQRLPADPARGARYLAAAVEETPRLQSVRWIGPDGHVIAEAESRDPDPEGEWRDAPARVALPRGGSLECVFAIEARFFAELDEARTVAERSRDFEKLGDEIRRTLLRSFGALLVAAAVVAALLGIIIARRTTRRVSDLVLAVRRLAAGDLAVQVDPGRSSDEVAGLARAFNAMVREVRESRDRIVYLEKISGWQEVARRLAHEIKNPLTPIKLAFQQLDAGWRRSEANDLDPEFGHVVKEAGEIVKDEIATLQRLVDEFSSFAKLPEVRSEPADLGEFVDEFLRTSPQVREKADVEVVKAAGAAPVSLDRALMRRVLANLCANATEAALPGRARVHLGVARTRDRAVLTVADEGPGIDRALRERIFDPYFTTKGSGTGLGLAIVKKIVLQHGGEIQVGDRPGGGASFSVVLPLRAA